MSVTPVAPSSVPANEFERFLSTLPEGLRQECKARLAGSGLSPNLPVFAVLADFYEKSAPQKENERDFYEEALLHSNHAKQLLADFRDLSTTMLAQFKSRLDGLLSAFTAPVDRLERTATDLTRNVEALPVLLLSKRYGSKPILPAPKGFWNKWKWVMEQSLETVQATIADRLAWLVAGGTCACAAVIVTALVLSYGTYHLSRSYDESYQQRLAHMEADSVENTVALNRLLVAGISLKVERSKDGDAYFLILQGAHKAAQPVNSPEGLAVEVWP